MKAKTVQVNWHDKLAIFSVDFDPQCPSRFATAGGDSNVRIWRLADAALASVSVNFVSSLARHTAAVNIVRFSPKESLLASAGDDGTIIIWRQSKAADGNLDMISDEDSTETWKAISLLRGSLADIYDLAWSSDGRFIISGSVDNTARIWDIKQAKCLHCIADHSHYVQGVAWDTMGVFFATQSSDRSVNMYEWQVRSANVTKKILLAKRSRAEYPPSGPTDSASKHDTLAKDPQVETSGAGKGMEPAVNAPSMTRLYHNENLASFFRRPTFTPDGSLLLTPAGIQRPSTEPTQGGSTDAHQPPLANAVFVYARDQLTSPPVAVLSGFPKPAIAVRCAPRKFCLRSQTASGLPAPWLDLPYRMVIAVATQDAILLYDTQQPEPFAYLANFHYATLTDVAWSPDCRHLVMTSTDGYCSVVVFEPNELGSFYMKSAAALDDLALSNAVPDTAKDLDVLHPPSKSVAAPPLVEPTKQAITTPKSLTTSDAKPTRKRIQPTFVGSLH
ncbi:Chromatin assembly factor 1 subunit [Dimargaris verticillata]|uniref:Chromatin assembly factor 1 subunit n=1 Tax=Dimargaris verticillata TaxID=2761393 RepID=A0A9W8B4E0_9FUNG|nr:Chromatin assembly factor 1 subunit [Dimargaris verticillata]